MRCRPAYGVEDESQREVRISCPDATGLGCDFARLLLDFGLRILDGASPDCIAMILKCKGSGVATLRACCSNLACAPSTVRHLNALCNVLTPRCKGSGVPSLMRTPHCNAPVTWRLAA